MKMLYATSNKYPSFKYANTGQILAMSKGFADYLGRDFYLGGKNINPESGSLIQAINFHTTKSYILGYKFIKFIKEKDIKAVYCREARLLFFVIIYNKLFFRLKLRFIYEIHALADRSIIDKIIEKALAPWVDNFIFITKNLRDIYIKKYRIPENKTLVCPDAVDLSIFDINLTKQEARQKLGLPEGKKIIAYTGKFKTMGMDKGISDILKALANLPAEVMFLAVGGSEADISYYQNQAQKLGVENKVKFISHVSQNQLAIYQKSVDILLMPFPFNQHYAYYMSPLKMFEYMASQRPIIASNLPSAREVLSEKNAIIVKPDDPEDLARGIKGILGNKELADRISQQAFRDVDNYTWEKRVRNILSFIE